MRSATSYFNGTLYRKTLARFWPLWGLWGVGWLFLLPLNFLNSWLRYSRQSSSNALRFMLQDAENVPSLLSPGVFLALLFAILCAMAVFGYLYNSRSACWTHALPLRREALFTTQYLAGLSFLLLPLAAAGVLTAAVEVSFLPMEQWGTALSALLTWLLAQSGICLFFFSFAAFCAMFTGHILALPAFYFILNCLVSGLWALVDALMSEFFYGYWSSSGVLTVVEYLTPAHALSRAVNYGVGDEGNQLSSPVTVAVYALAGAALFLVSLYVYRRRHVETAGDVVSIPLVRPLFKYGVSFCVGLCFGMFTVVFFNFYSLTALIPFILLWSAVGYFAAEMLLKKSFRVFRAWKGAAVMAAVLLALCLGCLADVFGVAGRVPAPGQVTSVEVMLDMGYPSDGGRTLSAYLDDPNQIQIITALHQAIVDNRDREGLDLNSDNDYTSAYLTYQLSNGSELRRRYAGVPIRAGDLDTPGTVAHAMQQLLADRELVATAYGFDKFLEDGRLTGAWLDRINNAKGELEYNIYVDDYAQELWDAVQQDFAEGTIGVRYLFDQGGDRLKGTYRTDLTFSLTAYRKPGSNQKDYSVQASPASYDIDETLSVTLTPNARHTLAVLEQTGIFKEGYSLAAHETADYDPAYPDTAAH